MATASDNTKESAPAGWMKLKEWKAFLHTKTFGKVSEAINCLKRVQLSTGVWARSVVRTNRILQVASPVAYQGRGGVRSSAADAASGGKSAAPTDGRTRTHGHSSTVIFTFYEANGTHHIFSFGNLHREAQIPKYPCFTNKCCCGNNPWSFEVCFLSTGWWNGGAFVSCFSWINVNFQPLFS